MNGRKGSWWGWLLTVFVLLAILRDSDVPVLPLLLGFFVLANVLGRRRGVGRQPDRRPGGRAPAPGPQDSPLPTIDVPRYPGPVPQAGPPSGPPVDVPRYPGPLPPTGQPPVPPTARPSGLPAAQPAASTGPAPHTPTDPVVSLGQLHLARCGRDLEAAAQHGTTADVARVLDETRDLSRRMQEMLDAAEGTPGSGRREFRAGLRAVDRLVEEARGEHPPGARLTRVTRTCLRMGQTGRHE